QLSSDSRHQAASTAFPHSTPNQRESLVE
ncbi:MAG: hypothetical protein Sylvanvirus11_31, partial [Sylvanvirus sp.]